MLTKEQIFILYLLRMSLGVQTETVDVPTDEKTVINAILKNGILLTVYTSLPDKFQAPIKKMYIASVMQSVQQKHEGERVLKAISDAGMKCIALKGWELRNLYPHANMRQMADLDVLVTPYKYNRIKAAISPLGFAGGTESSWKHDSFRNEAVHIEMHKRLTDDSDVIQKWENGIWDRATVVDGNIYRMSPEDYYIFHFVHLHKDFMNGSLGLRRIADTWLLNRQPVDMSIVKNRLESFGMWTFHERMVKLSKVTMGEDPMDNDNEFLLTHAFRHGIYGSGKSYKAGRIVSMGGSMKIGKLRSKIAAVFLPYKRMKAQYPILQRWPILLPWCWLKRILRFLKGNMKRNRKMLDYSDVTEEDYNEMRRFFEIGGVIKN